MAYNFDDLNIIIDDDHMVSGYASGNPVNLSFASDLISSNVGAKGEVAVAVMNDDSATLTINLQHTSPTNDVLRKLERKTFPVSFVDSNNEGDVRGNFKNCMVQTRPSIERGSAVTEPSWVIFIPKAKIK